MLEIRRLCEAKFPSGQETSSMIQSLKKSLLAGLGVVAFTKEKLEKALHDMVERGEITSEQGKSVLRTLLERGDREGRRLADRFAKRTERWLSRGPLVTRKELESLQERVARLESRELSAAASAGPAGSTTSTAP